MSEFFEFVQNNQAALLGGLGALLALVLTAVRLTPSKKDDRWLGAVRRATPFLPWPK